MAQTQHPALFESSLRLPGDASELRATITLEDDRIRMAAGQHEIGEWTLDDVAISRRHDGFHLQIEEEELIVTINDSDSFAQAVGIFDDARSGRAPSGPMPRARTKQRRPRGPNPIVSRIKVLPLWAKIAIPAALAVAIMAALVPGILAVIFIIAGMVVLLFAGLALSGDQSTYGIVPDLVSETGLVAIGFGITALGLLIWFIS